MINTRDIYERHIFVFNGRNQPVSNRGEIGLHTTHLFFIDQQVEKNEKLYDFDESILPYHHQFANSLWNCTGRRGRQTPSAIYRSTTGRWSSQAVHEFHR
jgi:hypothetical protein